MSKLLKSHGVRQVEKKNNREENLTKHVGFAYVCWIRRCKESKNRKINDENGGDKQKK